MTGRIIIHPGEILREEFLKPLEMTAYRLAKELHVPVPRIHDIVLEKRGISADTALRLGRYFNMSPRFWMNLQAHYELLLAESTVETDAIKPREAVHFSAAS